MSKNFFRDRLDSRARVAHVDYFGEHLSFNEREAIPDELDGYLIPSKTNLFVTQSFNGDLSLFGDLNISGDITGSSLRFVFGTEITDDFTLTTSEASKYVEVNKATAVTVTVPKDTFAEGDSIILEQKGAGQVTVAPVDGDVTLTGGLKTYDQYNVVQLVFKSANVVNIIGGTNV